MWLEELFLREDLDLNKFIAPGYFNSPPRREMPPVGKQDFFDLVALSQRLSGSILEQDPKHKDARYFLGSCHGLLGAFAITIDRDKTKAFKEGKKAYKSHKELVEEDRDYYDAYFTVGLYEYAVGNLPWYLKFLAFLAGIRGNEKKGLKYLDLAAEKGQYVADQAKALRMVLMVREKNLQEGLEQARNLHQKYPRSFLLHLNRAQILEKMEKPMAAAEDYLEVLRWAEEGKPNYSQINLLNFRFSVAKKLMELKFFPIALEQFQNVKENSETLERERALSCLQIGKIFDLQGKRSEAVAQYEQVLKSKNFESSHKDARSFLRRRYSTR